MMAVDIHRHFVPESLLRYVEQRAGTMATRVERAGADWFLVHKGHVRIPVSRSQFDMEQQLTDLAAAGMQAAVLSVTPTCFLYEETPEHTAEAASIINDWAAHTVRQYPGRLYAMGTLPMNNIPLALCELKRIHRSLGLRAIEIGAVIEGKQLDDPSFFPIYEYCAQNGLPIFLHPHWMSTDGPYARYYHMNVIGNVLETSFALHHLLSGGVFEAFPALKVIASHGGGYFPYQAGRMEHAYQVREEARARLSRPPSAYLGNIYYDSITHSAASLQFLADTFGSDHVLLGSDYPFDMGDLMPAKRVNALSLTAERRGMILGANAAALHLL